MRNTDFDRLIAAAAAENGPTPSAVEAASVELCRTLIVLDDDPTGTQSVADLPVLTSWEVEDFRWALTTKRPAVYVLTNSRSLDEVDAVRVQREIVDAALQAAHEVGREIAFVSRGDSTLRGHFPAETDAIAQQLQTNNSHIDAIVVVPAFPEAGRVTLDGVHWLRTAEGATPIGETEFARDATFGYTSSSIADWIAEKSHGRTSAEQVMHLSLDTIRMGPEAVTATLASASDGRYVTADILTDSDFRSLALGCIRAEAEGTRLLYRSGPPFVRDLIGQAVSAPVVPLPSATHLAGGLIVIGSHVGVTATQLARLREGLPQAAVVEVDVDDVLNPEKDVPAELAGRVYDLLASQPVILQTSRTLRVGATRQESLQIARQVSDALVGTVAKVVDVGLPAFVLAKGGITSSDVATKGLRIRHAMVRGSLLPGIVSLWHALDGPAAGLEYVVFPGNVGDENALLDVVNILSTTANRPVGASAS